MSGLCLRAAAAALVTTSLLVALTVPGPAAMAVEGRAGSAQPGLATSAIPPSTFRALEWRFIGPARGNRVSAVVGDPTNPLVFYYGSNGGGVYKTIDAGAYWQPMSDGFFKTGPVGALAVAASNPKVIYAGMGDTCMRPDMASGDGVYKSSDAGRTWSHMGLEETRHIAKIAVDPRDPNLVYVAAFGHAFGPNPERGVYRSKDGGATWQRVLFKSERAGAIDLSMDPSNSKVLYASIYQFTRSPWDEISGGPDSGLYRTSDGGDTWTELTNGLPSGIKGRIGVAMSPATPNRVWAVVEAEDGALFRSEDAGVSWQRISDQRDIRRSPSSYMHLIPHPKDPETLYILSYEAWKSTDGGRTFTTWPTTHGDNHDLWIDPNAPERMIHGNDGGATVTQNGGTTWGSQYNQLSAAIYRIAVDNQFPYRVYGTQQDNMAISVPSRNNENAIAFKDSYQTGGSESGYIAVKPDNPNIVVAGSYSSGPGGEGQMKIYDRRTDLDGGRVITIWPVDTYSSHSVKDHKYRFNWTYPIVFSPHDPDLLYVAGNRIFTSRDLGQTWSIISPDLSRNLMNVIPDVSGGPITSLGFAQTYTSVVFSFAESTINAGELWAGTDDGLVQLSRDAGKNWTNVTPKDWPEWLRINTLDVSRHHAGTAYVAANRYLMDDQHPYVYRTTDFGKTWHSISQGIGPNDFARVIREDPVRPGLLYLGTERGVHISFDAGATWQSLQLNLPGVAVHDLLVKDNDLVIGTHSRGFWILDDVTPLRHLTAEVTAASAHLFPVTPAYRLLGAGGGGRGGGREASDLTVYSGELAYREVADSKGEVKRLNLNAGYNPPTGPVITYFLKDKPSGEVTLTITDASRNVIKRFTSTPAPRSGDARVPVEAGTNRFAWDMRYPGARQLTPGAALSTMEWPRPTDPLAPPGRYVVRLEAAGQTREQAFEIKKDPRSAWSEADLTAQFRLWMRVRDRISETTDAVTRLREVRDQVGARARSGGPAVAQAADRITVKLTAIESVLTRTVPVNPMRLPPKGLHQQFATLTNIIGSGDGAPTKWTIEVVDQLSARLAEQVKQLSAIAGGEAAELVKVAAPR